MAREFGASTCTDVTGFGLLGHVVEMCKASSVSSQKSAPTKVAVNLFVGRLPLLEGAAECVRMGISSSLQPSNFRLRHAILQPYEDQNNDIDHLPESLSTQNEHTTMHKFSNQRLQEKYSLLFDPQTSGGLIVAIRDPLSAAKFVARLQETGYPDACVIGEVVEPFLDDSGRYIRLLAE